MAIGSPTSKKPKNSPIIITENNKYLFRPSDVEIEEFISKVNSIHGIGPKIKISKNRLTDLWQQAARIVLFFVPYLEVSFSFMGGSPTTSRAQNIETMKALRAFSKAESMLNPFSTELVFVRKIQSDRRSKGILEKEDYVIGVLRVLCFGKDQDNFVKKDGSLNINKAANVIAAQAKTEKTPWGKRPPSAKRISAILYKLFPPLSTTMPTVH